MNKFQPVATLKRLLARWFGRQRRVRVYPEGARNTSTWVIGQPGMGKSKFIESQIMQDIRQGRAVGLIDIHGDLFQNVRRHLAALTLTQPHLAARVVVIDPTQPQWTASINPLEAIAGQTQERTALFLTDIVIKIWQISPNESPRLVWLLTNTFLALANRNLSLAEFPRWLQDKAWRNQQVPLITHEAVRRYWTHEFPQGDKEIQQWIAPATNKLGGVLFDAEVRQVLTGHSPLTMRQIMDQGLILLVHIPKGLLGEKSAHLIAAFIVAQIQKAALSRAAVADRRLFYVYLDEFQNYTTDYIQDVLAESRKYKLSLILAHQFLDQLSTEMRSAVLNTAGTIISFRVGYKDARTIVQEVFPTPEFPLPTNGLERGSWEKLALELANLRPREFWVRRRGPFAPVKQRTLNIADPALTPELEAAVQRLMETSGRLYGSAAQSSQTSLPESPSAPQVGSENPQPAQADAVGSLPVGGSHEQAAHMPTQQPVPAPAPESEGKSCDSSTIFSDIVWEQ